MPKHPFDKIFTPGEANELIPTLAALVSDLQLNANELRARIAKLLEADAEIDAMRLRQVVERHPELRPFATRIGEIAGEIEEIGCFLKDIEQGLIDFPAEIDGEVVFLCWQYGEPGVSAWHPIDGGFGQRRAIPGAPKVYLN